MRLPSILVVEDEALILLDVESALTEAGFESSVPRTRPMPWNVSTLIPLGSRGW